MPMGIATGIGVGGAMLINKVVDVITQKRNRNYSEEKQEDRAKRLEEFNKRLQEENHLFNLRRDEENRKYNDRRDAENRAHQDRRDRENRMFQIQLSNENRKFQLEVEAKRLAFQERTEMRRLQLQEQMEKKRIAMQESLSRMNIKNSQEIARFQAIAMRETQILVARENAQNMMQDHLVQNALKDFPLNISPLVLLKNRPHSLSSLLRFTVGENCNIDDVVTDVLDYSDNPEPLNIFVAPVFVDSKIRNRKILSDQIWDTTYQKLESFFTEHYNRRSSRPVIFDPTAGNDKCHPGMHASETLHFFLRDMPCLVLEPRFDGRNFRLMISAWGLGYASTDHIRTELKFDLNIDAVLAQSAYLRSKKALSVIGNIGNADIPPSLKSSFNAMETTFERNVLLYESLNMDEKIHDNRLEDIDAVGIYNVFKIEPIQDLAVLADILSAQIGMTLATLTDIHHLRSTDIHPIFPSLMKQYFPDLYSDDDLRTLLFKSYENIFIYLRNEDGHLLISEEDKNRLKLVREQQIDLVRSELALISMSDIEKDTERKIRVYAGQEYKVFDDDFDSVWDTCVDQMRLKDKPFFEGILQAKGLDSLKQRQLDKKLSMLK